MITNVKYANDQKTAVIADVDGKPRILITRKNPLWKELPKDIEPYTEPEPAEEETISAMERKILREQAQERLARMTAKEKKELLK